MVSNKTSLEMVIETEHKEWLDEMVGKHALKDTSKAVRVLLNYAIEAGSEQEIFEEERCRFC